MTEPTLNSGPIMAEFRKPSGELVYLRKDNASVYLKKGFVLTGVEFSMDAWNQYADGSLKWKAVGEDQSAKSPPLYPGPAV